jgi:hypothetical protein
MSMICNNKFERCDIAVMCCSGVIPEGLREIKEYSVRVTDNRAKLFCRNFPNNRPGFSRVTFENGV